jgi:sterol desaturase/sphingolipid hydroxylase (fatty acid hydroxylase superfamily)
MSAMLHFLISSKPLMTLLVLGLARLAERHLPADRTLPDGDIVNDYKVAGLRLLVGLTVASYFEAAAVALVNAMGGGIVSLRSDGGWFLPSALIYLFLYDLKQYGVHFLSHRSAFFWSMHSLHHSARVVTVTSSTRHYWLGDLIGAVFILPVGLLLRVPVEILVVVAPLRSLAVALAHTNIRASYGFLSLVIAGPQYHRIHHSRHPEHVDKNLAELFPIWDVIFGTVWRPKPDEYPATGLEDGDTPTGMIDLILWPVRHRLDRSRTLDSWYRMAFRRHAVDRAQPAQPQTE